MEDFDNKSYGPQRVNYRIRRAYIVVENAYG